MSHYEDTILDTIINACMDDEDIKYENIPEMSLITAFWLMRINKEHYSSFVKKQAPNKDSIKIEHALAIAQQAIYNHFCEIFDKDFKSYAISLLDYIFFNETQLNSELVSIQNELDIPLEFLIPLQEILKSTLSLRYDIKQYNIDIQRYNIEIQQLKETSPYYKSELIQNLKSPSDIINLYLEYFESNRPHNLTKPFSPSNRLKLSSSSISRYKPWSSKLPQLWKKHVNSLKNLYNKLYPLKAPLESLFKLDDSIYCSILSKSHNKAFISKLTWDLRFPDYIFFNLETILIFLFINSSIQAYNPFTFLIQKYETFFKNIYITLSNQSNHTEKILFPEASIQKTEICQTYINGSKIPMHLENRLSVSDLKRLIALYLFCSNILEHPVSQRELSLCKRFDDILNETKLPYISYHPLLNDLPTYIMDELNLTQKTLSKMLGCSQKTITAQKQNKTLLKSHRLFWLTAEGCTYEYLNGETTIPAFGKSTQMRDNLYLIPIVVRKAHSEIFLKTFRNLCEYKNFVQESGLMKTNLLSKDILSSISRRVLSINDSIQKCREKIVSTHEEFINAQIQNKSKEETASLEHHLDDSHKSLLELLDIISQILILWVKHLKGQKSPNNNLISSLKRVLDEHQE